MDNGWEKVGGGREGGKVEGRRRQRGRNYSQAAAVRPR